MIRISNPMVYLHCTVCSFGANNEWRMTKAEHSEFIKKECPQCHFLDTQNALKPKRNRLGNVIRVKMVDY